jgi:hypothetical protein
LASGCAYPGRSRLPPPTRVSPISTRSDNNIAAGLDIDAGGGGPDPAPWSRGT